jgi:hypothetical protein
MTHRAIPLLAMLMLGSPPASQAEERWAYLENAALKIGIDLQRGGAIGWLSTPKGENVLNTYDAGRYVQQSYYGDPDGSVWDKQPWRYNPVQGGSWKDEPARVLDWRREGETLYVKTEPRQWASGLPVPEMVMEQWVSLAGSIARVRHRMTYTGPAMKEARHQELPAVFLSPRFETLLLGSVSGEGQRLLPAAKNEYHPVSQRWCAWQAADGLCVGLSFSHTDQITTYRVRNGDKADCSYLAPLLTFPLVPGTVKAHELQLMIGTWEEVQSRFSKGAKR